MKAKVTLSPLKMEINAIAVDENGGKVMVVSENGGKGDCGQWEMEVRVIVVSGKWR